MSAFYYRNSSFLRVPVNIRILSFVWIRLAWLKVYSLFTLVAVAPSHTFATLYSLGYSNLREAQKRLGSHANMLFLPSSFLYNSISYSMPADVEASGKDARFGPAII